MPCLLRRQETVLHARDNGPGADALFDRVSAPRLLLLSGSHQIAAGKPGRNLVSDARSCGIYWVGLIKSQPESLPAEWASFTQSKPFHAHVNVPVPGRITGKRERLSGNLSSIAWRKRRASNSRGYYPVPCFEHGPSTSRIASLAEMHGVEPSGRNLPRYSKPIASPLAGISLRRLPVPGSHWGCPAATVALRPCADGLGFEPRADVMPLSLSGRAD